MASPISWPIATTSWIVVRQFVARARASVRGALVGRASARGA